MPIEVFFFCCFLCLLLLPRDRDALACQGLSVAVLAAAGLFGVGAAIYGHNQYLNSKFFDNLQDTKSGACPGFQMAAAVFYFFCATLYLVLVLNKSDDDDSATILSSRSSSMQPSTPSKTGPPVVVSSTTAQVRWGTATPAIFASLTFKSFAFCRASRYQKETRAHRLTGLRPTRPPTTTKPGTTHLAATTLRLSKPAPEAFSSFSFRRSCTVEGSQGCAPRPVLRAEKPTLHPPSTPAKAFCADDFHTDTQRRRQGQKKEEEEEEEKEEEKSPCPLDHIY